MTRPVQTVLVCPFCVQRSPHVWVVWLEGPFNLDDVGLLDDFLCMAIVCKECTPWYRDNQEIIPNLEFVRNWVRPVCEFFKRNVKLVTEDNKVVVFSGRGLFTMVCFDKCIIQMELTQGAGLEGHILRLTNFVLRTVDDLRCFVGA